MVYLPQTDFYVEVEKGNVPKHRIIHQLGRNPDVPSGSFEFVSIESMPVVFLSLPCPVRIRGGGNAADDVTGAGARAVTITGIDENLVEVTEDIVTTGAAQSLDSANDYWRVYDAVVARNSCGVYGGANVGDIVVEESPAGQGMIAILAEQSQSQSASFTIPVGTTGFFIAADIMVSGNKSSDIKLRTRADFDDTTTPSAVLTHFYWTGVIGHRPFRAVAPPAIPALTDLWWEAQGGSPNTDVSIDFALLLVED